MNNAKPLPLLGENLLLQIEVLETQIFPLGENYQVQIWIKFPKETIFFDVDATEAEMFDYLKNGEKSELSKKINKVIAAKVDDFIFCQQFS